MGQIICAIVTDKKTQYDKNLIHFFENNIVIIPLDLDLSGDMIEYFIREADNFNTIKEYLHYLKTLPFYNVIENSSNHEHNITSIIDIIEAYELKNFSIRYYTEWGDMPVDDFYIAIIDGEIKKDSIVLEDDKFAENHNYQKKYDKIIGLNFSWIANEDRYYNYKKAKKAYSEDNI